MLCAGTHLVLIIDINWRTERWRLILENQDLEPRNSNLDIGWYPCGTLKLVKDLKGF